MNTPSVILMCLPWLVLLIESDRIRTMSAGPSQYIIMTERFGVNFYDHPTKEGTGAAVGEGRSRPGRTVNTEPTIRNEH